MRLGLFRLILAIMVVAIHSFYYPAGWPNIGAIAVSVFFFISGFLMPLSFESNYRFERFGDSAAHFFLNRLFRIYPWYWLSILLPLAHLAWKGASNEAQEHFLDTTVLLQNVLLLGLNQESFWGNYIRYNNPAWTLDVELQYYLLVPALVWGYRRAPEAIFGLFMLASIASIYLIAYPTGKVGVDRSLIAWSSLFLGGFLYYQWLKTRTIIHTQFLQLVGCLVAAASLFTPEPARTPLLVFALLLIACHFLAIERTPEKSPVDKFLGNLSYPVYIFHFFVIGSTQARSSLYFSDMGLSGVSLFLAVSALNTVVCVVFCSALVFVGEPVIDRIRSRFKRHHAAVKP